MRSWVDTSGASPLGNEGRGLKPAVICTPRQALPRIASRQRGAWIETQFPPPHVSQAPRIASRQRGAWIETAVPTQATPRPPRIASRQRGAWIETADQQARESRLASIASRQRGAWIETSVTYLSPRPSPASPLGNEGRGLKHTVTVDTGALLACIASRQRGAWIETCFVPSKIGDTPTGIASRQRGAWIETDITDCGTS